MENPCKTCDVDNRELEDCLRCQEWQRYEQRKIDEFNESLERMGKLYEAFAEQNTRAMKCFTEALDARMSMSEYYQRLLVLEGK